jgi:hypothetical protein
MARKNQKRSDGTQGVSETADHFDLRAVALLLLTDFLHAVDEKTVAVCRSFLCIDLQIFGAILRASRPSYSCFLANLPMGKRETTLAYDKRQPVSKRL